MPRTPSRFTQADARRIIAAAAQARVPIQERLNASP